MAKTVKFLNPDTIAKPPGYTHVVEITGPGRIVYVAGQLGLTPDGQMAGGGKDVRAQVEQAFRNVEAALAAVGAGFEHVVKINNYLVDIADLAVFREVRDTFVDIKAPPASTTVAISALARPDALFEIEAIAILP